MCSASDTYAPFVTQKVLAILRYCNLPNFMQPCLWVLRDGTYFIRKPCLYHSHGASVQCPQVAG